MLLARKLGRELRQQKGQTLAVIAVTALGVLLYVASAGGYLDLRDSYADTRARLALADLHVDVPRIAASEVRDVARIDGVTRAEARVITALPVRIGEHESRVELRVLSTPRALDRVLLLSGRLPDGPGEVLLEKHLAQYHHLEAGDRVSIDAPGTARTLRVSGVAVSAEYLWVARDESDVFATPDAFGVGWMDRAGLRALAVEVIRAAPSAAGLPGLEVAASESAGNQLLLDHRAGADVMPRVRALLGDDRVLAATLADDLVGVRLLQLDVDG